MRESINVIILFIGLFSLLNCNSNDEWANPIVENIASEFNTSDIQLTKGVNNSQKYIGLIISGGEFNEYSDEVIEHASARIAFDFYQVLSVEQKENNNSIRIVIEDGQSEHLTNVNFEKLEKIKNCQKTIDSFYLNVSNENYSQLTQYFITGYYSDTIKLKKLIDTYSDLQQKVGPIKEYTFYGFSTDKKDENLCTIIYGIKRDSRELFYLSYFKFDFKDENYNNFIGHSVSID